MLSSVRRRCRQDYVLRTRRCLTASFVLVAVCNLYASGQDRTASKQAVAQLESYLEGNSEDRPPLSTQPFIDIALTRADAIRSERVLWTDHVATVRATRADELESRCVTHGDLKMPFFYTVSGDKPSSGRSLYISLHGGGGAPPNVNDRQWENQKRLYRIDEGVYLAPRAPTNTWNLWHQEHIDGLLSRLIENLIVFEDVNPNRIYLLGYSAGGDGVYQLAPRMADRFAAAAMMAGHPNEASPLGLRNLPFTIHVGADDSGYGRNRVARQWKEKLNALQTADPEGYVHWVKLHDGKGHWMDREDAEALHWMSTYTRDPLPNRVVWRQDDVTHPRFYWLGVASEEQHRGSEIRATLEGQRIELEAKGVHQVLVRLNDRMLDLDKKITIVSDDAILHHGTARRTIGTLARTLGDRGDATSVFSAEIAVPMPSE